MWDKKSNVGPHICKGWQQRTLERKNDDAI